MTQPSSDKPAPAEQYPLTPDGRYLVVRGRQWRAANPGLTREGFAERTGKARPDDPQPS